MKQGLRNKEKNRSRDLYKTLITLNKNALIHLARLIDNPHTLAENLMTSVFRLIINSLAQGSINSCLAPFEKTGFVASWSKEWHLMLGMNFPKLFY